MLGRNITSLITIIVDVANSFNIWKYYPIKSITKLDDKQVMILIHDNLHFEQINKLNEKLNLELLDQHPRTVKANVALASAITSYARIHKMKFKTLPNVDIYYTDTDSFFVTGDIPKHLLDNNDIGKYKNELQYKENGIVKTYKITDAYFFDKKFYLQIR
uniref:DNA polymerase n=1 Tax=Peniophora lycii TaxID=154539 RepID=UPI001BEDEF7B|nr:DNA polymerase [Peniophora lycii]QUA00869.1 DNA polymerase [Peniophora lycii]